MSSTGKNPGTATHSSRSDIFKIIEVSYSLVSKILPTPMDIYNALNSLISSMHKPNPKSEEADKNYMNI